jgi:hypothetical protein
MTSPSRFVNLFSTHRRFAQSISRSRQASSASGFFIVVRPALYALAAERQALESAEALWRDLAPRARPKLRNQIVLIQFHFTAVLFRTVPG